MFSYFFNVNYPSLTEGDFPAGKLKNVKILHIQQLVEKSRCILPLPNLFPSLARRFACCQSCSVSLRTLWAYGFDSAAQRAPEKSKVGEKEKYFISFNPLYFLKSYK